MKTASFLLLFLIISPQSASAHAFGQVYNLPVPFWMYLYGASAVVILSFLIIGLFITEQTYSKSELKVRLDFLSLFNNKWFISLVKLVSISFFFLMIISGFIGEDNPTKNINMTFFWIIFILGVSYFTGFFGNIWEVINPIKIVTEFLREFLENGLMKYPKKFEYFPALFFYFLFIWIELFGNTTPFTLSILLAIYLFLQIMGIVLFGKKEWLHYGEFLGVFFRLLGKIGIVEKEKNALYLRLPFSGLVYEKMRTFSLVIFILFMLSSTAFDGLSSTSVWEYVYVSFYNVAGMFSGEGLLPILNTIGLIFSLCIFLLLYIAFIWIAKIITKTKKTLMDLLLHFAYSLIPIAFVYNVAHYFTLLITEGQNMYRLISDPFGYGWNVFGTRGNFDVFIPDVNIIWHTQVVVILLGHIAGVYVAHLIALKVFTNHKQAVISQIPMLILMVMYTMIGLWILSQPITTEL